MTPIKGSSCLLSAGWQNGLVLQFRYGTAVYFYPDAPESMYHRLMAAESKGRFRGQDATAIQCQGCKCPFPSVPVNTRGKGEPLGSA